MTDDWRAQVRAMRDRSYIAAASELRERAFRGDRDLPDFPLRPRSRPTPARAAHQWVTGRVLRHRYVFGLSD